MAIDNSFIIKKIDSFETMYVLYSGFTNLPFIECDEETMDDQVYVFTTPEMAQTYAHPYTLDKILLKAVQVPKEAIKSFFQSLYLYDVNAVMIQDEGAPVRVQLADICEKPDLEAMMNENIPRANPELQLTGIYFAQEQRRPIQRDGNDQAHLRQLEEEMAHNLIHSRFILTFDVSEVKGKIDLSDKNSKLKVPLVKTKTGHTFQPVYSDLGEMIRFTRGNKDLRTMAVPYDQLSKYLVNQSEGFVFNPAGFNLVLNRQQLEAMQKVYGD